MINFDLEYNKYFFKPDSAIYFLLYKNKIVYIGKSKQFTIRILNHIKQKVKIFDQVKVLFVKLEDLNKKEMHYIKKFQPKYNQIYTLKYKLNKSQLIKKKRKEKEIRLKIWDINLKNNNPLKNHRYCSNLANMIKRD